MELPDLSPSLYQALRDSIAQRGVLVPLVVCADTGEILDGKIRQSICDELGIRDIPTLLISQLSETDRRQIRISANCYRRMLTRKQLHDLIDWELRKTPLLSNRAVAGRIGVDHKTVGKVRVKMSCGDNPQRIGSDGRRYNPVKGKPSIYTSNRATSTVARRVLRELGEDAPPRAMSGRTARKILAQRDRENHRVASVSLPSEYSVRCCDFRNNGVAQSSVVLCILDPPWNANWSQNRKDFCKCVYSIMKPGAFAAVYTGHMHLPEWLDVLRGSGLVYVWLVAAMHHGYPGVTRSCGRIKTLFRPIVILTKPGGKPFTEPYMLYDVMTSERSKSHHIWEQPVSESVEIVRALSKPGSTICDLTCGSGTSGVGCALVGGRKYVGIDIDPRCCRIARKRIFDALGGNSKNTAKSAVR